MSSALEVVTIGKEHRLDELADAAWSNAEPGFQIEGVTNRNELQIVFDAVLRTTPQRFKKRFTTFRSLYVETTKGVGAHWDSDIHGLSIHQNLSEAIPVQLGIVRYLNREANPDPYGIYTWDENDDPYYDLQPVSVREVKSGTCEPGTLTVFPGSIRPWWWMRFRPAMHLFDRRRLEDRGGFASYSTYSPRTSKQAFEVERSLEEVAAKAFARTAELKQKAA